MLYLEGDQVQQSPGLCSTPLPPPFPADATLAAVGMSACLGGERSWEVSTGTLQGGRVGGMLQGAGEADAQSVLPTVTRTRESLGAQARSTHLPRCLFPSSSSLRNSAQVPQGGSSHHPHPHTCHFQSGLLQWSLRLALGAF